MHKENLKKYRDSGIKLTPQRIAIMDFLEGNTDHPSAQDIYNALKIGFPSMSFATVYSTLEMLRDKGLLSELTIDPSRKRFDPNFRKHHHLICTSCSKVVDVHMDFRHDLPAAVADDFSLTGNHIEFYGICTECSKKSSK
jgi:Fur family transcriptional regulator, peroxide stress response regulator